MMKRQAKQAEGREESDDKAEQQVDDRKYKNGKPKKEVKNQEAWVDSDEEKADGKSKKVKKVQK